MIDYIATNAATIATILFFVLFCYIIYSVFKKGAKKEFDYMSKIPMEDDKKEK